MAFRTSAEYLESLRKQRPEIWVGGERIEERVDYVPFAPTLNCWGTWVYDAAEDPEIASHMEGLQSLDGEPCHAFWHIPSTKEELVGNIEVAKRVSRQAPTAGYATIGRDELASLYVVSAEMAKHTNGEYYERVRNYISRFQKEQTMTSAGITDPKGDRRLRPAEQPDPDAYLRVVDRNKDGIIVRGCKMHTSGSVAAEEIIVAPTRAMREEDADYAVSFAIPVDTPGIKMIARAAENVDDPELAPISGKDQLLESFTIFEDVFVPWERVFMCGEWQYAGEMANIFANVNRQGYLGADVGKLDIFIGAARRIAELNGVENAHHIRDKITEMIKLQTLIWSAGIASALHCKVVDPGVAVPDPVFANTGKHIAMEAHFTCARLLLEIAGGAVITLPSIEDQRSPELGKYFDKYYRAAGESGAERIQMLRFIKDLVASEYAAWWYVEIIHGSGSPAAEWLQMYREYDLESATELAKSLAGRK